MTPEECQRVRDAVPVAFPSIATWWLKLDDRQRQAMERRNTACLIDCDYGDVLAVLADLGRSPVDPWPYDADKERAAAIIAQRANQMRSDRKQTERTRHDIDSVDRTGKRYKRPSDLQTMWDAAEELVKLKASDGWTDEQTADWLAAKYPSDESDRRERYECAACLDTGLITCLSTIRWIDQRTIHATSAAACHCQRGVVFSNRHEADKRLPAYDEAKHVKMPVGCSGSQAARTLRTWLERHAAERRVGSFDDFNQRSEF